MPATDLGVNINNPGTSVEQRRRAGHTVARYALRSWCSTEELLELLDMLGLSVQEIWGGRAAG